jgi:uncharacterized membrane protein
MKNKHVGLLIIGMAVLFFFIVMSFNNALASIVDTSCTHGEACPMHATVRTQQTISYSLIGFLVIVGISIAYLMKDEQKIVHHHTTIHKGKEDRKELTKEEKEKKLEQLDDEERKVMNIILRENGSVYQSDVIKETNLTKVKVSRILDKLEGRGLIERKRRGMSNIIIQK